MAQIQPRKSTTRFPLVTIGLGIVALVLFFCTNSGSSLQYDRTAMAAGEVWRGVTGHFLHWSFDHFLWCTIVFLALGSLCEGLSRKGYVFTLMAASVIIPVVSWFGDPNLLYYRGLSGLGSAIFVFGTLMMTRNAYVSRDWSSIWLPAVAGIAFMGKILFEFISGSALFVDSPEIFTPVPLVHFAGGGAGLLTTFLFREIQA
ncbi:MAG: rhombosortase [Desulfobulbaceae bacterium]|nr:rhombosortase [Desulfobulbaceae bacterium]